MSADENWVKSILTNATNTKHSGRKLILASRSPRRQELLKSVGVGFSVVPTDVDEDFPQSDDPEKEVLTLAERKGENVSQRYPEAFVLSADTLVTLPGETESGGKVLGKPCSEEEALEMLRLLQGKEHYVYTAFFLFCDVESYSNSGVVKTSVEFKSADDDELLAYIATGEPFDKAGGYGIQGKGAFLVSRIFGSYTNVVGLPLVEVLEELKQKGLWDAKSLGKLSEPGRD